MIIDWQQLREQKLVLHMLSFDVRLSMSQVNACTSIVHLIDMLQDESIETGIAAPQEVFGPNEERE